jgi:hypothetical protein
VALDSVFLVQGGCGDGVAERPFTWLPLSDGVDVLVLARWWSCYEASCHSDVRSINASSCENQFIAGLAGHRRSSSVDGISEFLSFWVHSNGPTRPTPLS